jgi:hypothetical protein
MRNEKLQKIISPVLLIAIAAVLRLIPHPANIAPIAAMALFGGVYLDKKYALFFPLLALFISDLFLGFHASMLMVYCSFFITGLMGLWLRNHKTTSMIAAASLASSLLFFILTNFNYWYATPLYPKTITGLELSYLNALPFFRNTIMGDLLYTGLFFGSFALMKAALKKPLLTNHT